MTARRIRIDSDTWQAASDLRKGEWRVLLTDLAHAELAHEGDLTVRAEAGRFVIHWEGHGTTHLVAEDVISPIVSEYLHIVRSMMSDEGHSHRLEALDMAKKVV